MNTLTVPSDLAATWMRSWDAQQENTIPDREERFTVLSDVLEIGLADVAEPVIVDLGCGPGSLAGRLHERLPNVRIIGIDSDPLLLSLARAHYGPAISWVDADLAGGSWRAQLPGTIHATVSTTALHWLPRPALATLYAGIGALTAPGGLLVNGDHLGIDDDKLDAIAHQVRRRRAARTGAAEHVSWQQWWEGVRGEPAFAEAVAARANPGSTNDTAAATVADSNGRHIHHGNGLSVGGHVELLRAGGFSTVAPVWQFGDDHVLVAVK